MFARVLSLLLTFTSCGLIATAAPQKPAPKIDISPASRTVLDRAAKFYGRLKSIDLEFVTTCRDSEDVQSPIVEQGRVQWERRGRLRLEETMTGMRIVMDGTRLSRFDSEGLLQRKVPPQAAAKQALDQMEEVVGILHVSDLYLAPLLRGNNLLTELKPGLATLKARLRPAQKLGGVLCDVVVIDRNGPQENADYPIVSLWIARNDGRLLRVHTRFLEGDKTLVNNDTRIHKLRLNPVLPRSTFEVGPVKRRE